VGGVGGRAQRGVLGMGVFSGATGSSAERRLQRRPVIHPAGDLREPAGVDGQAGKVRTPPVGPVGELLPGAGDGGPPQSEPARTVKHGASGLVGGVPLGVPAREQGVADPVRLCGDERTAGLGLLPGVLGLDSRL
jgi:hypothetical protein